MMFKCYSSKLAQLYRRKFGHPMMSEEEFAKWEEKHQKGLLRYILIDGTKYGLIISLIIGLKEHIHEHGFTITTFEVTLNFVVMFFVISILFGGIGAIYMWNSNQERYSKYLAMIAKQKTEES